MYIDKRRTHAFHAETLDESHPAHIRSQVIDFDRILHGTSTGVALTQIQAQVLHTGNALVPVGQRLLVHGADAGEAEVVEIAYQRTADKPACSGNDDQAILF